MRRDEMPVVEWMGYRIRWFREPEELPEEPGVRPYYYQTRDRDMWDLLAWMFYGNEELWYVIADVNGIDDPFEPIEGGRRLVIPPLRRG